MKFNVQSRGYALLYLNIKWLTMGFFKREDVSQSSLIEWHTLIEWNEIVCHSMKDDWETSSRLKKPNL